MDPEIRSLVERVNNLERGCRRWRAGALLLLLALAVGGIVGATRPKADDVRDFRGTLSARRFEVVNDDGKVLGRFGLNQVVLKGSTAALDIAHGNGHSGISLHISGDRPELMFYPSNGNAQVVVGIGKDDRGFVELLDKDGKEIKPKP